MTQTTLLWLLRPDAASADETAVRLQQTGWDALLRLAAGHHVMPWLYACLKERPSLVPPSILYQLKQAALLNAGRNLLLQAAFSGVAAALQKAAISLIPLKGIYLAGAVYPSLGDRVVGDLDLLVPKTKIGRAMRVVEACGYPPLKPVVLEAWLAHKHHICPQYSVTNRVAIELHWHIRSPDDALRMVPIRPLWYRAQKTAVFDTPTLTLAPEDTLLHLAYHLAYHHDFLFGLRNLIDIALWCTRFTLDWDVIKARATSWQMQRGLFLALQLAHDHLAAPIPVTALRGLRPDEYGQQHFELATAQLLTLPSQYAKISLTRRSVAAASGKQRLVALKNALFPSDSRLAVRYGWSSERGRRAERLGGRWRSLSMQGLKKMWRGLNGGVAPILRRKRQLTTWLDAERTA